MKKSPLRRLHNNLFVASAIAVGLVLSGCPPPEIVRGPVEEPIREPAPSPKPIVVAKPPPKRVPVRPRHEPKFVLAKSDEFVIVMARKGDTPRSLAAQFLGDPDGSWVIEDFNGVRSLARGQEVVIPLKSQNPVGVYADGYQTVPILCYHRFGDKKAKMVVTPESFARQMKYLADNDYRVIRLTDLMEFLRAKKAIPKRSVVITMDDGYKSNYQSAYPILKKYGFPATIFLYTDFLGAPSALNFDELREMAASGLIDLQPHSESHSNLGLREDNEEESAYVDRVEREISVPAEKIRRSLGLPIHTYAYPYGDTNEFVVEKLRESGYQLGVTVQAGGNAAFAYPFMLKRTMIFGQDDLETFQRKLHVFQSARLR